MRSVQLYGVDPGHVGDAVRILAAEHEVAHVDLNFGCPVPKVTRRGGGAALPWKRDLLAAILHSAVAAGDEFGVPVTMKTRKGIDDEHLTYLDAGRIAEQAGCAAIALHGRTAVQHYSGMADWDSIALLKQAVSIPVLGNGDIWCADDAVAMVAHTAVDGVVVGRGCLGRPWLFADLAAAFAGESPAAAPELGDVACVMRRHAQLLADLMGERRGVTDLRKHMAWYLKGFQVGAEIRGRLGRVSSLAELAALLGRLDDAQPYPVDELTAPRGRQGTPKRVVVPDGWLADRGTATIGWEPQLAVSGG